MLSHVAPLTAERVANAAERVGSESFVSPGGAVLMDVDGTLVRIENPPQLAFALLMTATWRRRLPLSRQEAVRDTIESLNREARQSRVAVHVDDAGRLIVRARLSHWVAPGASDQQLDGWLRRGARDLLARLDALDGAFPEEAS